MLLRLGDWSAGADYRLPEGPPRGLLFLACGVAVTGAFLLRRIGRAEVFGDSMQPALQPGDRLLLLRIPTARPGQLVAVPDPRQPARTVIKRVAAVAGDTVTVLGDNPSASTDSRAFGPVDRATIRGRAVFRYFPPDRRAVL